MSIRGLVVAGAVTISFPALAQSSATESVLYSFTGGADSAAPYGAVFKLSPPVGGKGLWTETTLYTFTGQGDGSTPFSPLVMDGKGNLYGTTFYGGLGAGTVFELSPPAAGQTTWTETTIYTFTDGLDAYTAGLLIDKNGNLFGTTPDGGTSGQCGTSGDSGCGTVFELIRPVNGTGPWTAAILHTFTGGTDGGTPFGGLVTDSSGALYGTTSRGGAESSPDGVAFKLTPPKAEGTVWTEQVLYDSPNGTSSESPLVRDRSGNLYGTTETAGGGTVFELSPPSAGGKSWTETVIYYFSGYMAGGFAGLVMDKVGDLFGTTLSGGDVSTYEYGYGTVFELTPPQQGGQTGWTETTLYSFGTKKRDGALPYEGLAIDKKGHLYGTTIQGGSYNYGTVFRVTQ
jgi:uncharacterized repeat protein (TIGR03803 family)